jgi:hypothetical protein
MTNIRKWIETNQEVGINLDQFVVAECVEYFPLEVYELIECKIIAKNIVECINFIACQNVRSGNTILNHFAW